MKLLSQMLKLNLVMNTHLLTRKKDNAEVHEDTQTNNKEANNDVEIEPAVDLTHNPRIKYMIKVTLLLENTVNKENRGFKNLCLFHPSQLKRKMMKNLNALLKC